MHQALLGALTQSFEASGSESKARPKRSEGVFAGLYQQRLVKLFLIFAHIKPLRMRVLNQKVSVAGPLKSLLQMTQHHFYLCILLLYLLLEIAK